MTPEFLTLEDVLEAVTMAVARGEAGKEQVADFFRSIAH